MPYKQGHEEGLAETREMTMKYNMEILGSIPVIHLALRVLKLLCCKPLHIFAFMSTYNGRTVLSRGRRLYLCMEMDGWIDSNTIKELHTENWTLRDLFYSYFIPSLCQKEG